MGDRTLSVSITDEPSKTWFADVFQDESVEPLDFKCIDLFCGFLKQLIGDWYITMYHKTYTNKKDESK